MTKRILKILITALLPFTSTGFAAERNELDSLYDSLSRAASAADSIPLLYGIFDSAPNDQLGTVSEMLYRTARNSGNERVALDALRLSTTIHATDDSMQLVMLRRAESMPESDLQRETVLYIKVKNTTMKISSLREEERQQQLHEFLSRQSTMERLDIYQQVEYLFYLCAYLRCTTEGELLTSYLQKLESLIDKLPVKHLSIRSLFYSQAALSYLNNGLYDKSIEANRKLLDVIDELEKRYEGQRRVFRNYDYSYYNCFCNLLRCYERLAPEEIDIYYNRILTIASRNRDIRGELENRQRPTICYLMAKKRYGEAIPMIKRQLDMDNSREEYHYLIEALIRASEAAGDKEDLLFASMAYNDILLRRIETKAGERYKELQIIYEVNDLKQANNALELEKKQISLSKHRQATIYTVAALAAVVVMLIIVYTLYRRARRLSANLSMSNKRLLEERDSLKQAQKDLIVARDKAKIADRIKTDFINNMSHEIRTPLAAIVEYSRLITDCADDNKKVYLKRFADIVSLNTQLMLTLVNDVLDIAALENSKLNLKIKPTSVKAVCELVIASVRKRVAPGVELVFANAGSDDLRILTDPHRVEQVLLNLLTNAAKFTEKGSITIGYATDDDRRHVTFTVTDTGCGIPQGKEEIIFSRFEKLDLTTQGCGLGLYICRLLATLLKGEIKADPDYRKGARFIFTIPIG